MWNLIIEATIVRQIVGAITNGNYYNFNTSKNEGAETAIVQYDN